jgi:predicted ATPase
VLLFEDLHWATEGTLAFLRHLTDHAADLPLLVVGTTRPELLERDTPFTSVAGRWTRIDVRSLSSAETGRIVKVMIGAPVVAAEMEDAIARRCGGNPFLTEELLHFLQAKHLIAAPTLRWPWRRPEAPRCRLPCRV